MLLNNKPNRTILLTETAIQLLVTLIALTKTKGAQDVILIKLKLLLLTQWKKLTLLN